MMKRFVGRAAICFAAMSWGAAAHAETGGVFVIGSGQDSCGKLIAAVDGVPPGKYKQMNTQSGVFIGESTKYQEWLMGFVSGFNVSRTDEQQVKGIDLAEMDLWMRNWCNQNPTKTVFQGAFAFIEEMRSNAAAGQR
jgi:hypothetical protein